MPNLLIGGRLLLGGLGQPNVSTADVSPEQKECLKEGVDAGGIRPNEKGPTHNTQKHASPA